MIENDQIRLIYDKHQVYTTFWKRQIIIDDVDYDQVYTNIKQQIGNRNVENAMNKTYAYVNNMKSINRENLVKQIEDFTKNKLDYDQIQLMIDDMVANKFIHITPKNDVQITKSNDLIPSLNIDQEFDIKQKFQKRYLKSVDVTKVIYSFMDLKFQLTHITTLSKVDNYIITKKMKNFGPPKLLKFPFKHEEKQYPIIKGLKRYMDNNKIHIRLENSLQKAISLSTYICLDQSTMLMFDDMNPKDHFEELFFQILKQSKNKKIQFILNNYAEIGHQQVKSVIKVIQKLNQITKEKIQLDYFKYNMRGSMDEEKFQVILKEISSIRKLEMVGMSGEMISQSFPLNRNTVQLMKYIGEFRQGLEEICLNFEGNLPFKLDFQQFPRLESINISGVNKNLRKNIALDKDIEDYFNLFSVETKLNAQITYNFNLSFSLEKFLNDEKFQNFTSLTEKVRQKIQDSPKFNIKNKTLTLLSISNPHIYKKTLNYEMKYEGQGIQMELKIEFYVGDVYAKLYFVQGAENQLRIMTQK